MRFDDWSDSWRKVQDPLRSTQDVQERDPRGYQRGLSGRSRRWKWLGRSDHDEGKNERFSRDSPQVEADLHGH